MRDPQDIVLMSHILSQSAYLLHFIALHSDREPFQIVLPFLEPHNRSKLIMALFSSALKQEAVQKLASTLQLHALPLHFNTILLTASFYYLMYNFLGPWMLRNYAPFEYSKMSVKNRLRWDEFTASFSQSLMHNTLLFYITFYQKRFAQTPQERMLGYDSQIASVVAFSAGYFLFHFYQVVKDRNIVGPSIVSHGVCGIIILSLGFVSLHCSHKPKAKQLILNSIR